MIVKMPIADWLPYPPPLYINIGFGPRENHNNELREFLGFYELTLYMIFAIFLKMAIPIMVIFLKSFKNPDTSSTPEFAQIIFGVISFKNDNLGLKLQILQFIGIQGNPIIWIISYKPSFK